MNPDDPTPPMPPTRDPDPFEAPEDRGAGSDAPDPRRRALIQRFGAYGATLPVSLTALIAPQHARAQGGSDAAP